MWIASYPIGLPINKNIWIAWGHVAANVLNNYIFFYCYSISTGNYVKNIFKIVNRFWNNECYLIKESPSIIDLHVVIKNDKFYTLVFEVHIIVEIHLIKVLQPPRISFISHVFVLLYIVLCAFDLPSKIYSRSRHPFIRVI